MAQRLVIVRHAKAEQPRDGLADPDREVTKSGMRACRAAFPRAFRLLSGVDREGMAVWSSPARRAVQTAAVAADSLGVDGVELHPTLYAQDPDRFLAEVGEAEGTVVAVGHNPFLENLFRRLSGHAQALEKCAAASFVVDASGATVLEWFVQGPDHRRWKTISQVERALKRSWEKVRDGREAFLADPLDVETLHRYRIALRVARSLLQFLSPYLRRPAQAKAASALAELARETSRLRELDVFAAEVHGRKTPGAETGRLALELEIARNAARAELMASLQSGSGTKRLRRVKRFLKDPAWKGSIEGRGLGQDELAARFDETRAGLESELAACDFEDVEATHDLRKRTKRLRYVARELGEVLGEERAGQGHEARELQEKLGEVCDARVNGDLAQAFGCDELAREQREQAELLIRGL